MAHGSNIQQLYIKKMFQHIINEKTRKWFIFVASSIAFGAIMLDETIVATALPTIKNELSMSLVSSHWVINSYLLVIAGLIAVGGKLGDIIGYRILFTAGVVIFGISSFAAGFSDSTAMLISTRAIQGIGGAIIFPASMAIMGLIFPPEQRGFAMGIYGAIGSIMLASGPLIGGYFTDEFSWRWIFWINVPVAAIVIFIFLSLWEEPTFDTERPKIDILGLVTLVLGTGSLVFAIMQGSDWGWNSHIIISLFIAAAVILIIFSAIELKIKQPLIELDLFSNGTFSSSNLLIFTGQFTKTAVIVFGALYFQQVLKMDPFKAGLALMPAMIPVSIGAIIAGRATDRIGPRLPCLFGLLLGSISLILMGLTTGTDRYVLLIPTLFVWGATMPFIFAPALVAVMNTVPEIKQGQASGIVLTAQILGASVGLAVLSAILIEFENFKAVFLTIGFFVAFVTIVAWFYLDPQGKMKGTG